MRRRTWALVRAVDISFSHQVSLPSMISEYDCDTELPHNLYDEEFGPDTQVLPPCRPNAEPTPVSYMISKVKLCLQLGIILQATGRVKNQVHYDEILRLDAKLRDVKAQLPPHLKLRPLEGSEVPFMLIMARFSLDILYLKIMCLLHRKYIPRARHNPRCAHSRRSAIEASLQTLRHLATLHRESQPGARLHSIKWYVTAAATKEFVLPAMLIALDLHFDNEGQGLHERQDSQGRHFWTREQRGEMISSLELTRDIWKGLADTSMEALKASNTLEIMLQKIKSSSDAEGSMSPPRGPVAAVSGTAGPAELKLEHSAAVTLGMLSSGTTPGLSASFNTMQAPPGTTYGTLEPSPDSTTAGTGTSTAGMGGLSAYEFPTTMLGLDGTPSPLSMFDNMASGTVDFPGDFDWVWLFPSCARGLNPLLAALADPPCTGLI